jgi:hypothetical protein
MATVLDRERIRGKGAASHGTGESGGGSVDDTQKRLTAIETTQAETKIILQGLATKTELEQLRSEVRTGFEKVYVAFEKVNVALEKVIGRLVALEAVTPHMATKAEVTRVEGTLAASINRVEGTLSTSIARLHASMIRWVVGTGLACMTLAVAIARLLR